MGKTVSCPIFQEDIHFKTIEQGFTQTPTSNYRKSYRKEHE